MTPETLSTMRELDSRTTSGMEVRLLWCERSDRLVVTVNDSRTGEVFSVDVPQGERPLMVFDHPYAYAV